MENFSAAWQDVLFSDTMQALVLELVTFLIRVISTDSPSTPDNQRSLQQRQREENYIKSCSGTRTTPAVGFMALKSITTVKINGVQLETKLNFHVQTDRWGTEHSQHRFSSTNTFDQGPLQPKHSFVSRAICPFLLLSSLDMPFLTTTWRQLCAGCSSCWNLFNNKEESLIWVPPQHKAGEPAAPECLGSK